jgi:dienelactone hydrolase
MSDLTRRGLLRMSAAAPLAAACPLEAQTSSAPPASKSKSPGPVPGSAAEPVPLNGWSRMVQEHFVQRLRRLDADHARRVFSLKTRAEAQDYIRQVRRKIAECFGPMPQRTPLKPRVTGAVERDAYVIEKVIFDSRPDFPVTANLYLPKTPGKKPGVVGVCGHSANGKAAVPYQGFAQGLARLGYVVLIIDPIGQGERLQYVDEKLKPRRGSGTAEHLYGGNQQFLVGEFFGAWRAWDGIRALDYLLTRPEVDPRHVGLTGNSGGGTMTTWLAGLDDRWTMAAPSCFVTSFRRNLENELPADTEQCPPGALLAGLDHCDFLAALAPRPVVLLGQEKDYFDARGLEEAFRRLRHLYTLLGEPRNIQLAIGPDPHGYSQPNRTAMYRFFNSVTAVSSATEEPALTIEKDETLQCTPRGQVAEFKPRTLYSFTAQKSRQWATQRPRLQGAALIQAVARTLNIPTRQDVCDYRILRPISRRGYPLATATIYALETQENIHAIVHRLSSTSHVSRPSRTSAPALLYVAHQSADVELRHEPLLRSLIESERDAVVYCLDVRGIGQSKPSTCNTDAYTNPYGADYFYAIHSQMLGEPMLGRRTHDVLVTLDWLAAAGHERIHLAGLHWGSLPAALAGLLHDAVDRVTLKHAPPSFSAIAESEEYRLPLALLPFNVLAHWDLPQVYDALAGKKLQTLEPLDAAGRPA